MKIFGYELRKFEETNTTIEAIETYVVKWYSLINKGEQGSTLRVSVKVQVQAFPTKESANIFAKELNDAINLLGHTGYEATVYKQDAPTNKA